MPRFSKLGHVGLNVTNVERSREFYENHVGLAFSGEHDGVAYLRCSSQFQDISLHPAREPGLRHVGWEMESEAELDALPDLFSRHGIAHRALTADECAALHLGRGIKAIDPATGLANHFYDMCCEFGGEPYVPTHTRIQRLGHILVQTPEVAAAMHFYRDVLGFAISDSFGEISTFMRCFPNPFHHSFGIGRSERHKFNHINFMVSEVDDIGKALWRCQAANIPVVHGPGRHPPSGSMFLYFLDPDGLTVEYSFGMEMFPEEAPRKPRRLEPRLSSLDFWGSPIDPRKAAVGNVAQATLGPDPA